MLIEIRSLSAAECRIRTFMSIPLFPSGYKYFLGKSAGGGKGNGRRGRGTRRRCVHSLLTPAFGHQKKGVRRFAVFSGCGIFFETSDTLLSLSARSRKKLNCTHRRRVPLPRLGFALWRMVVWAASRCVFRLILIKFPACRAERYFGKFF